MRNVEYNIYFRDEKNASIKAKADVSVVLNSLGYSKLYTPSKFRIIRIVQQFMSILLLSKDTVLFIQYPSNIAFFYRILARMKKIKKIALIHDLESLRKQISIDEEVRLLNGFDFIISHNKRMTSFLIEHGVKRSIVDLHIFDYLLDDNIILNNSYNKNTIFFAGNLVKSKFLNNLALIEGVVFNLYGAYFKEVENIKLQPNVFYKGSFRPEELIANIEGGWGLVWDGDSIETCSGPTGEYLKYNNPHKVSMCIVSERPIIIWSQSAMADYIIAHGLGIAVNNLKEINDKISKISPKEYETMRTNVVSEKMRLISGQSLKDALNKL